MSANQDYARLRSSLRCIALTVAFAGAIGAMAAGTARAERWVFVNDQRLSDDQISYLEQVGCAPIPNGRYWLNTGNGLWGYAGDPRPQGYIGQACNGNNPYPRPGLSQRGLLFSPRDWVR